MTLKDIIEDERKETRAEGREQGRAEGFENGSLAKAREMAKAMLQGGKLMIADVAAYSGLFETEIKKL